MSAAVAEAVVGNTAAEEVISTDAAVMEVLSIAVVVLSLTENLLSDAEDMSWKGEHTVGMYNTDPQYPEVAEV